MASENRDELSKLTQEERSAALQEKERLLMERETAIQEKERQHLWIDHDLAKRKRVIEKRELELDFVARDEVFKQKEQDQEQRLSEIEKRESQLNWDEANIESQWSAILQSENGMRKAVLDQRQAELDEKEQKLLRTKEYLKRLEVDIQRMCPERLFNPFTCQTERPKSIITGKTIYLDRTNPYSSSDDSD